MKKSIRGKFLNRLVNRKTLETLAGFLGGGWLIYEIVHWILIEHYNLPEELEDITIIAVLIALVSVLVSRSFKKEKAEDSASTSLGPATGESFAKAIITPKWKASIVVLPFANISPEEGQEYFCDGMTEEIITDLSYLRDLRVISRSSAMTLKGSPKPVCEVAKELDVQYVLEGSVRKAGNDLRITAQLIDAKNDARTFTLMNAIYRPVRKSGAVRKKRLAVLCNSSKTG
jgi:TolB-like protein